MLKPTLKHVLRLAAVATVIALPIAGTSAMQVHDTRVALAHIERERAGLDASLIADGLLVAIEHDRIALLDRGPAAAILRRRNDAAVTGALRSLDRDVAATIGVDGPRTQRTEIEQRWQTLLRQPVPADRARSTVPLAETVLKLLLDIDDSSGLTYDPTVDSINLSDALMVRLPGQRERRDQSAEIIQLAGGRDPIPRRDIIAAERLSGQADDAISAAFDDVDGATQAIPELQTTLSVDRSAVERDALALDAAINTAILTPSPVHLGAMQRARRTSVDASDRLLRASQAVLASSFERRMAALRRRISMTIWAGGAGLATSFLAIWLLWRAMRRRDARELARAHERSAALETALGRRNAERALRLTEQQFRAVFDGSHVGIAIVDRSVERIDSNDAFRRLFAGDTVAVVALVQRLFGKLEAETCDALRIEQRFDFSGREPVWTEVSLSLIRSDAGAATSAIVLVHDITEHKLRHERLDYETLHDALTDLPNRVHFMRRLESRMARADEPFAVAFIDLDRFKSVNDTLGHHAGDRILRLAARRLSESVRPGDFVARLHGDEFAVLLADLAPDDVHEIATLAARLAQRLRLPVETPLAPIIVSASIGVVYCRHAMCDAEQFLRDADAAMYQSKLKGGGCATLCEASAGAA